MIRYRDLTEEQKAIICNGCGPKGGWIPVPEFFLHEICDHHDFNYWIGGPWWARLKADFELWFAGAKRARWNPAKQTIALVYGLAVVSCGWTCFHFADRERDETDLAAAMGVAEACRTLGEGFI